MLIVGTHPEYWSEQMYDRLQTFLDAGGSLLYLGGNGIYQVVSYSADRSALTVRPRGENTAREFSMFRTGSRPERKLLGVATERCGAPSSPFYSLLSPSAHPLVAGLPSGLAMGGEGYMCRAGTREGCLAPGGLLGASGWEVDHWDSGWSKTIFPGGFGPLACTLGNSLTPGDWEVPGLEAGARANSFVYSPVTPNALPDATMPVPPEFTVLTTNNDATNGIITYRHRLPTGATGGQVFSVGSLTFVGALVKDGTSTGTTASATGLTRLVRNAIDRSLLLSPRP